jgi:hypothetical protein
MTKGKFLASREGLLTVKNVGAIGIVYVRQFLS